MITFKNAIYSSNFPFIMFDKAGIQFDFCFGGFFCFCFLPHSRERCYFNGEAKSYYSETLKHGQ